MKINNKRRSAKRSRKIERERVFVDRQTLQRLTIVVSNCIGVGDYAQNTTCGRLMAMRKNAAVDFLFLVGQHERSIVYRNQN